MKFIGFLSLEIQIPPMMDKKFTKNHSLSVSATEYFSLLRKTRAKLLENTLFLENVKTASLKTFKDVSSLFGYSFNLILKF